MTAKRPAKRPSPPLPSSSADGGSSSASEEESPPAGAAAGASSSPAKRSPVTDLAAASLSSKAKPSVNTASPPPPPSANPLSDSSSETDKEESDTDGWEDTEAGTGVSKESPPKPSPEGNPQPNASTDDSSDGSSSEDSGNIFTICTPCGADPSVKPISSRPMDQPLSNHRPSAKAVPRSSKRKLPKENGDSKRRKKFERVWSDTSELTILRCIISFHKSQGTDPSSHLDLDAFYDFLKKGAINSQFTKDQLRNKLKALKGKYGRGAAPVKGGPATPEFELGMKIWERRTDDQIKSNCNTPIVAVSRNRISRMRHAKASRTVPAVEIIKGSEEEILVCDKAGDPLLPNLKDLLVMEDGVSISQYSARAAVDCMDSSTVAVFNQKLMNHTLSSVKHHIKWLEIRKEAMELYAEVVSGRLKQPADIA